LKALTPTLMANPIQSSFLFSKFLLWDSIATGIISPFGQPIWGWTVEDYLQTIGEEIALDDETCLDPWYTNMGKLYPTIDKLQQSYKKADPPPTHVKPIPLPLVRHAVSAYHQVNNIFQALMDLIITAFFFLLCPGTHLW
jgi:hypothetical protein